MPDFVSLSNVFIDDILIHDGRIYIGILGGAGVHAMAGARVWSDSIGLIASIGDDFEEVFEEQLRTLGLDLSMLRKAQEKTTRAWQIFQPNEERIEIYRDKKNKVHQLSLDEIILSEDYKRAKGYHFHFDGPVGNVITNLEIIRLNNPSVKIVMEPTIPESLWGKKEFSEIFKYIDVFSPNVIEGKKITGFDKPNKMVEGLLNWGATKISLRMGEFGSLIGTPDQDITHIPAISETLVDVTGAGNAYLGGLLVSLCEGFSFTEAALRGAVSASFAIEQFGICFFDHNLVSKRNSRLDRIHAKFNAMKI